MNSLRQNIDIKNTLQTTVYITPQMKQSLAMLQMPIVELAAEISIILEENPVLETSDADIPDVEEDSSSAENSADGEDVGDVQAEQVKEDKLTEIAETVSGDDWEEYIGYEKADDISYKPMSDDEGFDFEDFIGSSDTLFSHLMKQLSLCHLNEAEKSVGEYIIGNLDDNGYFRQPLADGVMEAETTEEVFKKVLETIKAFDPSGIASANLKECIVTQMLDGGCDEVYAEFAGQILETYSAELSTFKYEEIMKGMSIERDTLDYILFLIKKTDPKPGLSFASSIGTFITPDVFIIPKDDGFEVVLNESGIPAVRLNDYYLKMIKTPTLDTESKQYIKEKIKNAVWVIESLQKRQKAIYKVVKAITEHQGEFLREGITKLKPLRLKDIAETTDLHESTVSRVTSGKYAMTTHGLIELKNFFAKSLESEAGDTSTGVVKNKIKDIIDKEDSENPLSDQRIVELMDGEGIKIARRTVAKYRDELNLPTMSQRKRLRR